MSSLVHLPLHLLHESLCHKPVLLLSLIASTGHIVEQGDLTATQRVEGVLLLLLAVVLKMVSHSGALES